MKPNEFWQRRRDLLRQQPQLKVGEALKIVTAQWRALKADEKAKLKNIALTSGITKSFNQIDKNRFLREMRSLSSVISGNKAIKHCLREDKSLASLFKEDEVQKPKKPLTPYMLFVREVTY